MSQKSDDSYLNFNNNNESKILNFSKNIQLKELTFSYKKDDKNIIHTLNLDIQKGESIGIVGQSGIGKSTLIDIFLGIIKPLKGTILVDGANIHENPTAWRELIGYVPQKINVINGSLKDNKLFGLNISNISDQEERINETIQKAELREFVNNSKNGIDTLIGDKGLDLSGGQLQRLAIARAIIKKPKILILDESTNALDDFTEKKIISNLLDDKKDQTIIMISHNKKLLNFCNKIYEIKNLILNKINF